MLTLQQIKKVRSFLAQCGYANQQAPRACTACLGRLNSHAYTCTRCDGNGMEPPLPETQEEP